MEKIWAYNSAVAIGGGRKYRCKVDAKVVGLLLGVVVFSFLSLLVIPANLGEVRLFSFVSVVVIWLITAPFLWPIDYTINDEALIVRFGVIRRTVRFDNIQEAEIVTGATVKPLAAIKASMSMDRVLIRTVVGETVTNYILSPEDREAFLKDLQSRDSGFQLRDGKLTR